MIKFFRKIRQKLLSDNKFSKYLIYAMGEIVLVVIGILIALYINNWNEARKRSDEEVGILKDLKIGLESDLADLQYNVKSISSSIAAADRVIKSIENDSPYYDSIPDLIGRAMFPVKFVYSTSAFETLKSKGIDLISNPKLRDAIVDVYDSGYTFFIETERAITLDAGERALTELYPTRFEESYVFDFDQPDFQPRLVPLDYEKLKKDQEFIYFIKSFRNRLDIFMKFHYQKITMPNVENLIGQIENELNN